MSSIDLEFYKMPHVTINFYTMWSTISSTLKRPLQFPFFILLPITPSFYRNRCIASSFYKKVIKSLQKAIFDF